MARPVPLIWVLALLAIATGLGSRNSCRIDVDAEGFARVRYDLLPAAPNTPVSLRFIHEPRGLEVRSGSGLLPYELKGLRLSTANPSTGPLTIEYGTDEMVAEEGDVMTLTLHPPFSHDITYSFVLPERAEFLARNSTIPDQVVQEGRSQILLFEGPAGTVVVAYRLGGGLALALPALFLVFALGWVAYLLALSRPPREPAPPQEGEGEDAKRGLDYVLRTLDGTERAIVQELLKADGELLQTTLRSRLSLEKYPLARALDRMERKKVVVKERVGKVNRIRLARWLVERQ